MRYFCVYSLHIEQTFPDSYMRSSFGWDPPSKHKELFDPNSRFMLARTDSAESCPALVGFVMFRFEHEDEENIVYWSIVFTYLDSKGFNLLLQL